MKFLGRYSRVLCCKFHTIQILYELGTLKHGIYARFFMCK